MRKEELEGRGFKKEVMRSGTILYKKEGDIRFKQCTKCKEILPAEKFNKTTGSKTGLNSSCRICQKEYRRVWAERNPNYDREYYKENKEKIQRKNAKYREGNPNYMREWYLKNKDRQDAYKRSWMQKNPEWGSDNKRKYRLRRPEIGAVVQSSRRAREYGAIDTLTTTEYKDVLEAFGHACAFTGRTDNLSIDHVIPLSIPSVGNVKENVLPLNHSVNMSKGNRNLFSWYQENKDRFGIRKELFDKAIEYISTINGKSRDEYRELVDRKHREGNSHD